MNFVGWGSLFSYISNLGNPISEDETKFYAAQVVLGLESIHKYNFIYRDLKLENILFDEDG